MLNTKNREIIKNIFSALPIILLVMGFIFFVGKKIIYKQSEYQIYFILILLAVGMYFTKGIFKYLFMTFFTALLAYLFKENLQDWIIAQ
jgi:hypothetical protein